MAIVYKLEVGMEGEFGRGSWEEVKPIGIFQLKMKDACIF
jgi:hypothetical protein